MSDKNNGIFECVRKEIAKQEETFNKYYPGKFFEIMLNSKIIMSASCRKMGLTSQYELYRETALQLYDKCYFNCWDVKHSYTRNDVENFVEKQLEYL
jgi:hypothetical protein